MNDISLDDLTSATIVADVPAPPASPPVDSEPGVRESMLSGQFVGKRDIKLEDEFAAFLTADAGSAILAWFGDALGRQLLIDTDALRGALDRDIAMIDHMVSEQLDAIAHDPRVRKLEGTWRGLLWLVDGVEQGTKLKIKTLNISWSEICRDLERAIEFDQSQLFRKIYEEEFGTPGGEPYGLMVIDHEVRHRPSAAYRTDDVNALSLLSSVAAAAFCPIILGASLLRPDVKPHDHP